ncbi:MAG: serine/threonine-protein kinase [Planctomycetota bacterium]|nr:serine/threonine-protein kinase [Planctomycetota bacterium]
MTENSPEQESPQSKRRITNQDLDTLAGEKSIEGKSISGFKLQKLVSKGASGLIFQAKKEDDDQEVAFKILRPNHLEDPTYLKRFQQEISLLEKIKHPTLVQCVGSGMFHNLPYYSMEFIRGKDFENTAHHRGRAPALWAVRMGRIVAEAVGYLHRKGIIHRDITPRNVLIEEGTNRPVLTDLGVAKWVESMSESWDGTFKKAGSITQFGDVIGTPQYMAPEQLRPQSRKTGKRTDVYGIGAVLYFALTGMPPFEATDLLQLLRAVQEEPPLSIREIRASLPKDLDHLILSCLSKKPESRPGSATQLAKALAAIESDLADEKVHPVWGKPWEPDPESLASTQDPEDDDVNDISSDELPAYKPDAEEESQGGIFGDFELIEELDRDGTGVVWRAVRTGQNRTCLLKRAHSARHSILERFRREAQTLAGMSHANIISVVLAGEVEGIPFFTMDLASGDHLAQYLASGRRPPEDKIKDIMKGIAEGLAFLHDKGLVHRNLRPQTIYMTANSIPKLTGFSVVGREGSMTVVGDPSYRPPEQAEGQPIDLTADIYAMGAIFFQLLTSKVLHDELSKNIPMGVLVKEVEPQFQAVLHRALSYDPRSRFQSAKEFVEALDAPPQASWRKMSKRITGMFSRKKLKDN